MITNHGALPEVGWSGEATLSPNANERTRKGLPQLARWPGWWLWKWGHGQFQALLGNAGGGAGRERSLG